MVQWMLCVPLLLFQYGITESEGRESTAEQPLGGDGTGHPPCDDSFN